mmetsp:Transcript_17523/g.37512  ORF Transcript_17523/g.37512 Transcript_17523/m.37512 type:complete len:110 (+) Transcript_17523:152-481(+)
MIIIIINGDLPLNTPEVPTACPWPAVKTVPADLDVGDPSTHGAVPPVPHPSPRPTCMAAPAAMDRRPPVDPEPDLATAVQDPLMPVEAGPHPEAAVAEAAEATSAAGAM